ncbi:MAG TPA: preprotein translocase subunit SecG [Candidatus Saccharimonadales bacterium]|nr:preprotein translocase subunit SecG [Candidatus Saccharimonadales bacterium]
MKSAIGIVEMVLALLLILTILLQTPKSSGLGGTIGGGTDMGGGYRTRRGLEKVLFRASIWLTVAFALVAVIQIRLGAS